MAKDTNLKPLFDNILIEPVEEETTLPSGIVIPDTAKEKPQKGKVIAVGEGKTTDDGKSIPMVVEVGDVVMYKKWGGTEVKIQGKEHLLVKQDDIVAIYEE